MSIAVDTSAPTLRITLVLSFTALIAAALYSRAFTRGRSGRRMHSERAARFGFAHHVPVPLVDLALLQTQLPCQLSDLGLRPSLSALEFPQQELVLILVLAKAFLTTGSGLKRRF